MDIDIHALNKVFESHIRLAIMVMLCDSKHVSYSTIKSELNLTDGNAATHIKVLENSKYIKVSKKFVDNRPCTEYSITVLGKTELSKYVSMMRVLFGISK